MTLDAQGHDPDESPAPPASTRWSEEGAQEDDGLPPPYIPGRSTDDARTAEPAADAGAPEEAPFPFEAETTEAETPGAEPFPFEAETPEAETSGAEPFPFEAEPAKAETSGEEPFPFEAEPTEAGASGTEPFPFEGETAEAEPFPVEGPEPTGESATVEPEVADTADDAFPFSPSEGAGAEESDDFPFDAFDLGGAEGWDDDSAASAAVPEFGTGDREPPMPESSETVDAVGVPAEAATDLADRLEWLAQTLRTEGRAGLEREVSGGDRLTALVAGVLAGYLAGRGD